MPDLKCGAGSGSDLQLPLAVKTRQTPSPASLVSCAAGLDSRFGPMPLALRQVRVATCDVLDQLVPDVFELFALTRTRAVDCFVDLVGSGHHWEKTKASPCSFQEF